MTAQIADFFEYGAEEYCLMGYTGGILPRAKDFGMSFYPSSTATAAGYWMIYGINAAQMLVVKRIAVSGEEMEPITHPYKMTVKDDEGAYYDLNHVIPLTGYVLFSEIWRFSHLRSYSASQHYPVFEACINEGHVVSVTNISAYLKRTIEGRERNEFALQFGFGNTNAEKLAHVQRFWDFTATILPRRYDVLYASLYYFSFPEYFNEHKS